jgi:N-acetylmuramoyl-L-alanine amidase
VIFRRGAWKRKYKARARPRVSEPSKRAEPVKFTPDSALVAEVVPSSNYDERKPDAIILHSIGSATSGEALRTLCAPEAPRVSAHYFVTEEGRIVQLVPEAMRAWHAGPSAWGGRDDMNSRSIGIEVSVLNKILEGAEFQDAQIEAVIDLCLDVAGRHLIRPERVLAHSDIAPARKQDPGEKFPWGKLHARGVGHWTEPASITEERGLIPGDEGTAVASLQSDLKRYGYGIRVTGRYDLPTLQVVQAFQRHFRPARVDGIADPSTLITLQHLLEGLDL